jgi:hypothetical protein
MNKKQNELYDWLPKKFTRRQAMEICKQIGLNERYFEISLRRKKWNDKFQRVFQGEYEKVE